MIYLIYASKGAYTITKPLKIMAETEMAVKKLATARLCFRGNEKVFISDTDYRILFYRLEISVNKNTQTRWGKWIQL